VLQLRKYQFNFGRTLNELEKKGGEVEDYRKYVTAVSGIKIDVTDSSAAWMSMVGWLKSEEGGLRSMAFT